jgi:hypothetical protein
MARDKDDKKAKYGIAEFAKAAGIKEDSARNRLRKAGMASKGVPYGWNTMEEVKAAVAKSAAAVGGAGKKAPVKAAKKAPAKKVAAKKSKDSADKAPASAS